MGWPGRPYKNLREMYLDLLSDEVKYTYVYIKPYICMEAVIFYLYLCEDMSCSFLVIEVESLMIYFPISLQSNLLRIGATYHSMDS